MHLKIDLYKPATISFIVMLIGTSAYAQIAEDPQIASARKHLATELPHDVEVQLALSGAPEHLRADAAVYVFKATVGFVPERQGSNGFSCLLNRDAFFYGRTAFKPTCWDANGADSYVPVMLAVGRMLAAGHTTPEIQVEIDAGFESGQFSEPDRPGIAYMVAGDLDLDSESGQIRTQFFPDHFMIYAPNITNEDLGTTAAARRDNPNLPVIFSGGAGGARLGYLITMVGNTTN